MNQNLLINPTKISIQRLQDGLQPSLILVDAQMPLMDGYEFLG